MKKSLIIFGVFFIMIGIISAAVIGGEAEYIHIDTSGSGQAASGMAALKEAKALALDGMYTQVAKYGSAEDYGLIQSEVESICRELAQVSVMEEEWDGSAYRIKVKVTVETEDFKSLAALYSKELDGQEWAGKKDIASLMKREEALNEVFSNFQKSNKKEEPLNLSIEMVLVEGGTFHIGSSTGADDEKPVHEVILDSFWMGKYEVTQKEWESVMGTNPSKFKGETLPVETVSWRDIIRFCNQLSLKDGLEPVYSFSGEIIDCDFTKNGYRLPTEAEWEYAARGGQNSMGYTYSGANDPEPVAWFRKNSGKKTHPVGTKQPNELGLYDMSGNVWEWCWDRYDGNYYAQSPSKNPKGKSEGSYRVLRGGSWRFEEEYLQTTKRNYGDSSNTNNHRGFRLVRTSKNE